MANRLAAQAQPRFLAGDRRNGPRLEVMFTVGVETELYGSFDCLARNISSGGMFLQVGDPLPLGTVVRVSFSDGECEIIATGCVRNHYYVNYAGPDGPSAIAGMGVSFSNFEVGRDRIERMLH